MANARRITVFRYRSLPAGSYDVRSILIGTNGKERATVGQTVTVLGTGGR
jgi:hypothetical protein